MTPLNSMIYLLLLLSINVSCMQSETEQENTAVINANQPELSLIPQADTLLFSSAIRSILQDSKGRYWLGSHNEGACLFDGKSFKYFNRSTGLIDDQVRTIQEDSHGNIWFGTANGISMYDGEKLRNYATDIDHPRSEWEGTSNNLWFNAGDTAGVNCFDGQKMNYLPFPLPEKVNPGDSYGVTGISEGIYNELWIATYASLFKFDGESVMSFDQEKLAPQENGYLHIRSVFADSKGRVWIGNNGIGVLLMQGNSVVNFSDDNGLIHANSNRSGDRSPAGTLEHVFAIEEDSEGNIWFGDRDTGAWKFDGKTVTNYVVDEKLSASLVWTIYNDSDNHLLFGMEAGGVYEFNGESFEKKF